MRRSILIITLGWFAAAAADPRAFIVNNLAETLSRIDLETGEVQNHIVVLGNTPNQVAYHNGNLYVLNSISADMQVIDPSSYQVTFDIPLPVGSNPYSMEFQGNYAYVSGWISGRVYRVNLTTHLVDDDVEIGGFPEGILFYDDSLYVAQTGFNPDDFSYGQGRMAVIDVSNLLLVSEVNVGKNPQSIIASPDGILHVVCTGNYVDVSGSIYVLNPFSGSVIDSILIGGQPVSGAVWRDTVFLAAGGWVDEGYVYSYNAQTHQIIRGPSNPILVGLGAAAVAIDSLGFVYSCNFGNDTVTKFNTSGQVLATYGLGDGPQAIVILDDRTTGAADPQPQPGTPILTGCYPNPFNFSVKINLSGEWHKPLTIGIFDITGRLVQSLNAGTGRGESSVIWNGEDKLGKICASGFYFVRIISGGSSEGSANRANALKIIYMK